MMPRRLFAFSLMLACAAALTGCASITEEECHEGNWRERGLADGQRGVPGGQLQSYLEICTKAGAAVDVREYRAGHAQGIPQYCTAERGRQEGLGGRSYRNACPASLEPEFLSAYRAGKRVYDAEQRLNRINSEIQDKERRLRKTDDPSKRRYLRSEIQSLDREARRTRDLLYQAERRLRDY